MRQQCHHRDHDRDRHRPQDGWGQSRFPGRERLRGEHPVRRDGNHPEPDDPHLRGAEHPDAASRGAEHRDAGPRGEEQPDEECFPGWDHQPGECSSLVHWRKGYFQDEVRPGGEHRDAASPGC